MKKILLLILVSAVTAFGQWDRYHPEYNWYTIKGRHVVVHFHEGAERTARIVAKIADEVWDPITTLYEYEPETVHFVIKDIDDYANGATYFFDNKIEIWASSLDFDLRGAHNWLRNVISHEFTHMVQIQASIKTTRSIPAVYLQFLNYEDKRRDDILYGFPNFIASYPVAMINVPAWFAEGTAQYMRKDFNYDNWDTHRDMILRSYALEDKMLSWNEMGVFSKTSLGNESVYNAGFALTRYISQKYGEDKLREISYKLGKLTNFTIDAAFEDVLGKSGADIYDEWSSYLKNDYFIRTESLRKNLVVGDTIAKKGFGNFYPALSPDGKKLYYVSNKSADYFGLSSIYEYDLKTGKEKSIAGNVRSTISFLPGGNKIIYSKLSDDNKNWINIHDIYSYDMTTEEETRLTHGLRANNPNVSKDGKYIVFLFQRDGTTNVGRIDADGKNFKRLTFFENGEQVYNPKFSEDGNYIIFDYSYSNGRDIAKVNIDGSGFEYLIQTKNDERNGIETGGKLYYSSDKTGIFNIYRRDLSTGKTERITNVLGGAFMPAASGDGTVYYAGYTSGGYKIFKISESEQESVIPDDKYIRKKNPPLSKDRPNGDLTEAEIDSFRNFNDYIIPDYKKEKYKGVFSRMTFFPFIRYDNYVTANKGLDKIKPGVYFTSSDMLNRYSLFGGGSINRKMERDLFLNIEYREKLPLLYSMGLKPKLSLELYSVSRKTDVDIVFDSTVAGYSVPTDVTYDLFEVDFAAKHKIFTEGNNVEFRFVWSRYSAAIGSFIFPNTTTLYPSSSDAYYIGRDLRFTYTHDEIQPTKDMDINPTGRKFYIKYDYEFNKYNPNSEYEVKDGVLLPVYENFNFHRLEINWTEYFEIFKDQTLTAQFRAGTIFGPPVPDFFDFYLGGLIGMKSYPFYSISGNELGWFNLTYRMPILKHIDGRLGPWYFDKLYFSVYGDYGNAWTEGSPRIKDFKKGAGAELRLKMISFYIFPTSLFFNASYSFDKVERKNLGSLAVYGKEWRFYGGILFDFNF